MKLTQEQEDKAIQFLKKKKALRPCSACGQGDWQIIDEKIQQPVYQEQAAIPCVMLVCTNCGLIRNFSSVVIGIDEAQPVTRMKESKTEFVYQRIDEKLLQEWEEIERKAMPGPWRGSGSCVTDRVGVFILGCNSCSKPFLDNDAQFVAMARTAFPILLKAYRYLLNVTQMQESQHNGSVI